MSNILSKKAEISLWYTSNERCYFSLSIDISNYKSKWKSRKWDLEKLFFDFHFLIVYISTNNVLYALKLWVYVGNIHFEGTVSQMVILGFSFYFIKKERVTFYICL